MVLIQIITIVMNFSFLAYISFLIVRGRLREEYAIVWIICTILLMIFSFWRAGLEIIAKLLGVFVSLNLVFTGAIFAILIYLLHLSVVASKLHKQNKQIAQDVALLREKMEEYQKK